MQQRFRFRSLIPAFAAFIVFAGILTESYLTLSRQIKLKAARHTFSVQGSLIEDEFRKLNHILDIIDKEPTVYALLSKTSVQDSPEVRLHIRRCISVLQTAENIGTDIHIALYVGTPFAYTVEGRYFKNDTELPAGIVPGFTYCSLLDGSLFAGRYIYDPNDIFTPIAFYAVSSGKQRLHKILAEMGTEDGSLHTRITKLNTETETHDWKKENGSYKAAYRISGSDIVLTARIPAHTFSAQTVKDLLFLYGIIVILSGSLYLLIKRHNKITYTIAHYELKALQNQINPHFLYNSLDIINCIAIEHNHPEISAMAANLIGFYRLSLNRGDDFILLKDEIEHISCYLRIINMRYPDAVSYTANYEPRLEKEKILKIILQPLVENAVFHGILEKDIPKGRIDIYAYTKAPYIMIEVRDDGVGMPEKRIKHLLHKDSSGYGLKNVHERITLVYGSRSGLGFTSSHQGTTVTVRLYSPETFIQKRF